MQLYEEIAMYMASFLFTIFSIAFALYGRNRLIKAKQLERLYPRHMRVWADDPKETIYVYLNEIYTTIEKSGIEMGLEMGLVMAILNAAEYDIRTLGVSSTPNLNEYTLIIAISESLEPIKEYITELWKLNPVKYIHLFNLICYLEQKTKIHKL